MPKEKGGRKRRMGTGRRAARSKPGTTARCCEPPVPPFKTTVHRDLLNTIEEWRIVDDYEDALRDMIYFYDKVRGVAGHGEGWTVAEVLRMEQIRKLAGG
jgi:hypothetical protein